MLGHSDRLLTFGTLKLSAGTADFDNEIDTQSCTLTRFNVAVDFGGAKTSGGTVNIALSAKAPSATEYTEIAKSGTISDFTKPYYLNIPELEKGALLKASLSVTGTFTDGTVTAQIDNYVGV